MLHWLYWLYRFFFRARRGKAGASPCEADAAQAERVVAKAESRKQKAEIGPATTRRVAEDLRRRGWREAELTLRRKADPEKVEMAWRLRRETTMTLKWIAKRLKMGVWTHVSNCLVQKRKQNEKCQ